jgi:hypothetical protein
MIVTALPESGMKGKVIYESSTGKWLATGETRQEWLP